MLYPLKKPKRAYTIQAVVQTLILLFVFYIIHKVHSVAKILLTIGVFVTAFGRIFIVVPMTINMNHSDPNEDRFSLSIWFTFTILGDILAILLLQWLMDVGVLWNYAFMIYMLFYMVAAILHHFCVEELEIEERNREETICEYIGNTYNIIK